MRRDDVSVLFARADSCYFDLVQDVWDEKRDARGYAGPSAVVAHPPCRGWGRLSHRAHACYSELALGPLAVELVRRYGGVLEHPHASKLWAHCSLPIVGARPDQYGGLSLLVDQGWWGHAAPKPTWLYVVGVAHRSLIDVPVKLRRPGGRVKSLTRADRERTPIDFALWLVELAARCRVDRSIHCPV